MAKPLIFNNKQFVVTNQIETSTTQLIVNNAQGVAITTPGDWIVGTLVPMSGEGRTVEIVHITATSGNTFTVQRAKEGTTAQMYLPGAVLELRVTAGLLEALGEGPDDLRSELADPTQGANMVGFQRTPVAQTLDSLAYFLQGFPYSLWEFANLADRSGGPNKDDWEWTGALQGAFNTVPDGGTLFVPPGNYKINGNPVLEDKNINIVCMGTFVLSRDQGAFISMVRNPSYTINGSQLQHLPSKGDAFLYPLTPPVEDAQNYIVAIKSTENEITRIGDPEYTPYKKNEANELVSATFRLRAPIKLTYSTAAGLQVLLYKKGTPVRVSGLRIRISETGLAPSRKPQVLSLKGISNVSFDHIDIDRTTSNWPGMNVWIQECALLSWEKSFVRGFNSSAGDAYAWLGEISAFITLRECGYVDGTGTKEERGWAARHCSHVLVDNCRFSGVDDHYGHNYIVQNMTMSRGIGISGGSLTVRNVVHTSTAWALVTLRSDSPYADGDLVIDNCSTTFCLLWSIRDADSRNTKRKTWDRIRITNNYIEGRAPRGAITVKNNFSRDNFSITQAMWVQNNHWIRAASGSECFFFHGSTPAEDEGSRRLWVALVNISGNMFANNFPASYTSVVDMLKTDRLISENNTDILYTGLSAWNASFDGDSIGIDGGAPFSFQDIAGWRRFRSIYLSTYFSAFSGATGNTSFTDCFFASNPFTDSAFVATIASMSANTANDDTSGTPGDIWDYQRV